MPNQFFFFFFTAKIILWIRRVAGNFFYWEVSMSSSFEPLQIFNTSKNVPSSCIYIYIYILKLYQNYINIISKFCLLSFVFTYSLYQ